MNKNTNKNTNKNINAKNTLDTIVSSFYEQYIIFYTKLLKYNVSEEMFENALDKDILNSKYKDLYINDREAFIKEATTDLTLHFPFLTSDEILDVVSKENEIDNSYEFLSEQYNEFSRCFYSMFCDVAKVKKLIESYTDREAIDFYAIQHKFFEFWATIRQEFSDVKIKITDNNTDDVEVVFTV